MLVKIAGRLVSMAPEQGAEGGASAGSAAPEGSQESASEGESGSDDVPGDEGKPKGEEGKLDDQTAHLLKDVMKWKNKARENAEAVEKLKSASDEVASLKAALGDLDPEKIREIAEAQKDAERQQAEKRGEYERIVAQMKEENGKKLEVLKSENQTLKEQLAKALSQNDKLTVGHSFSNSEWLRDNSVLPASIAQKEFGDYFEFKDGRMVGYDKPASQSDRTPIVDDQGEPKGFEDVIAQLYQKHPDSKSLIRAKRRSGAGSGSDKSDKTGEPQAYGVSRIARSLKKG